ncbi:hypothetical protein MTP99_007324 [Tenebrio molitor]|jgi:hypothetical protein|nr:hypothetical protein MTP99_007324 [Tenebrio molitor]
MEPDVQPGVIVGTCALYQVDRTRQTCVDIKFVKSLRIRALGIKHDGVNCSGQQLKDVPISGSKLGSPGLAVIRVPVPIARTLLLVRKGRVSISMFIDDGSRIKPGTT